MSAKLLVPFKPLSYLEELTFVLCRAVYILGKFLTFARRVASSVHFLQYSAAAFPTGLLRFCQTSKSRLALSQCADRSTLTDHNQHITPRAAGQRSPRSTEQPTVHTSTRRSNPPRGRKAKKRAEDADSQSPLGTTPNCRQKTSTCRKFLWLELEEDIGIRRVIPPPL
ncbi:hypothetical protein BDY19DRAFT_1051703 [Irpex rosettiformis]|uniref:Uncharacterized protein n=1 Tax=Irpex rosettiformis TaxID=378272 RepID=A0ACB8TNY5_9APHY|nr:hypothetical protein BDY19DRAFT_1051703 [Irpex rosettiformis]